jgi:hypothetical protein
MALVHDRVRLRREAQPLHWSQLDITQQGAFTEIVQLLHDAVRLLDMKAPEPKDMSGRTSRVALISGDRGTGKTSLMCSLKAATREQTWWDQDRCAHHPTVAALEVLRPRLIWLEPLDMEMLPGPVNLLAAILARIERALEAETSPTGRMPDARFGLFDFSEDAEDALQKFRRLQRDIAIAWVGTTDRLQDIDPDTYASHVLDAEQARLGVCERIREVLDSLARFRFSNTTTHNALFVLPVDDFDLNPGRCLELLRLLRLASVPRLFSIVLGDRNVAEWTLKLKLSGEYAALVDRDHTGKFTSVADGEVASVAGVAAFNIVRKLLPPSQCVTLRHMTVPEAIQYPRHDNDALTIGSLLQRFAIRSQPVGTPRLGLLERGIDKLQTLADLLGAHNQPVGTSPRPISNSSSHYFGSNLLAAPPRHVADLWFDLSREVERAVDTASFDPASTQRASPVQVSAYTTRECILELLAVLVQEDANLSPDGRKCLLDAFERQPDGRLRFQTDRILVGAPLKSGIEIRLSPWTRIKLGHIAPWRFEPWSAQRVQPQNDEPRQRARLLSDRTTAAVMLVHDLMMLDADDDVFGTPISAALDPMGRIQTGWNVSNGRTAWVSWPEPAWATFWGVDQFAARCAKRFEGISDRLSLSSAAAVAYCYWSAAIDVARGVNGDEAAPLTLAHRGKSQSERLTKNIPTTAQWRELSDGVDILSDGPQRLDDRALASLFVPLIAMLAPEAGLPPEVISRYLTLLDVCLNIYGHAWAPLVRAARAKSLVAFMEVGTPGLGRILLNPDWFVSTLRRLATLMTRSRSAPRTISSRIERIGKTLQTAKPTQWKHASLIEFRDLYEQCLEADAPLLERQFADPWLASVADDAVQHFDALHASYSHPLNIRIRQFCPSPTELRAIYRSLSPSPSA